MVHGSAKPEGVASPSNLMDAAKSSVEMLRLTLQAALTDGNFPAVNWLDKKLRTSVTRAVQAQQEQ